MLDWRAERARRSVPTYLGSLKLAKFLELLSKRTAHIANVKRFSNFSKQSNILFKQKKGKLALLHVPPRARHVRCDMILTLRENNILSKFPGDAPPSALPLADTAADLALDPAVRGRHDLFLLSAFYNARPQLFLAVPRITLVAHAEGSLLDRVEDDKDRPKFECVFNWLGQHSPTVWRVPAKVARFGEWHHYEKVQPCYIHCNLEGALAAWLAGDEGVQIPERVSVSIRSHNTLRIVACLNRGQPNVWRTLPAAPACSIMPHQPQNMHSSHLR
jgi:hypothetical protein